MSRRWMVAGLLLLCVVMCPVRGDDITGYFKQFTLMMDPPNQAGIADRTWSMSGRVRMQYQHALSGNWQVDSAAVISLVLQNHSLFTQSGFAVDASGGSYRFADFDNRWFPSGTDTTGNWGGYFNLDRLALKWEGDRVDVTIGRQAISWGDARVVNPTDIFAPYAFTELDSEYRHGVDAVRVRYATGSLGELDAGVVLGHDARRDQSAVFFRSRSYVRGTDWSTMAVAFKDHLMLGLNLSRALGGSGVWIESAYVDTGCFNHARAGQDYVRVSVGIDRQLTSALYAFAEYHFNGAGANQSYEYSALLSQPAYRDGGVYLFGRHYVALGTTLQISPLIDLSTVAMVNMSDGSSFASVKLEKNVTENAYVSVGVYLKCGASGPSYTIPSMNTGSVTEFGSYPFLVYFSFRQYF